MREPEWINTPEARQRRGERSLFAIDDILPAMRPGRPKSYTAAAPYCSRWKINVTMAANRLSVTSCHPTRSRCS